MKIENLPEFVNSWYCIAKASALGPKKPLTRSAFGQKVELYINQSGKPACTQGWPVEEKNGWLFIYFSHDGSEPNWYIPRRDWREYQPLKWDQLSIDCSASVLNRLLCDPNIVAAACAEQGYRAQAPLRRQEHALYSHHAFSHPATMEHSVQLLGLGYCQVDSYIEAIGLQQRTLLMTTPLDAQRCLVRVATSPCRNIGSAGHGRWLRRLPSWLLLPAIHPLLQARCKTQVAKYLAAGTRFSTMQDCDEAYIHYLKQLGHPFEA